MKKWFKKYKKLIVATLLISTGTAAIVLTAREISKAIEVSRREMMKVVENNLKLVDDGEFVDIIVGNTTDDFNRIITTKRWTKKNGETLYLGKIKQVVSLSDDEKIAKQVKNITRSINNLASEITKRSQ